MEYIPILVFKWNIAFTLFLSNLRLKFSFFFSKESTVIIQGGRTSKLENDDDEIDIGDIKKRESNDSMDVDGYISFVFQIMTIRCFNVAVKHISYVTSTATATIS